AQGLPVVFRTLDVGADKAVPGIDLDREENPFLGVRGIRLSLQRRDLFDTQLRALARAARQYPTVRVMVPMVGDVQDLRHVHDVVADLGVGDALRIGTMIEVPSAALLVREIAPLADFLSIGTNDLTSYVLAVDRTNSRVQDRYDELHPAVLRMIELVCAGGRATERPVSVCGEIAGDLAALPVLVGLGVRALSVAAPLVPRVKAALALISAADAADLAGEVMASGDASQARAVLSRRAPE
ncbi:MAG: multiphosphoryl transfer protein, partial [Thermoleophilaceae bacterium]|nr:multiphosphoryl transfer protein [Thermoleophilaceae bacterium]